MLRVGSACSRSRFTQGLKFAEGHSVRRASESVEGLGCEGFESVAVVSLLRI
jgi:hypothetical protein